MRVCVCSVCTCSCLCTCVHSRTGHNLWNIHSVLSTFSETESLTGLLIAGRLHGLTSDPWESACLSFHSARITSTLHCVQSFCGVLGIELSSSCLQGKPAADPHSQFCLFLSARMPSLGFLSWVLNNKVAIITRSIAKDQAFKIKFSASCSPV